MPHLSRAGARPRSAEALMRPSIPWPRASHIGPRQFVDRQRSAPALGEADLVVPGRNACVGEDVARPRPLPRRGERLAGVGQKDDAFPYAERADVDPVAVLLRDRAQVIVLVRLRT